MVDLSVITATYKRPKHLAMCLAQFRQQSVGNLRVEQIVVSDGPDPQARFLAQNAKARYVELDRRHGLWGAAAKDAGIAAALGEYVCFWDDDNLYESHALSTLFAAAVGVDIGVVQVRCHKKRGRGQVVLPRAWTGVFRCGDIDTMNVCVRRQCAALEPWADGSGDRANDFRWLHRLSRRGINSRYVPIEIGEHL